MPTSQDYPARRERTARGQPLPSPGCAADAPLRVPSLRPWVTPVLGPELGTLLGLRIMASCLLQAFFSLFCMVASGGGACHQLLAVSLRSQMNSQPGHRGRVSPFLSATLCVQCRTSTGRWLQGAVTALKLVT